MFGLIAGKITLEMLFTAQQGFLSFFQSLKVEAHMASWCPWSTAVDPTVIFPSAIPDSLEKVGGGKSALAMTILNEEVQQGKATDP